MAGSEGLPGALTDDDVDVGQCAKKTGSRCTFSCSWTCFSKLGAVSGIVELHKGPDRNPTMNLIPHVNKFDEYKLLF